MLELLIGRSVDSKKIFPPTGLLGESVLDVVDTVFRVEVTDIIVPASMLVSDVQFTINLAVESALGPSQVTGIKANAPSPMEITSYVTLQGVVAIDGIRGNGPGPFTPTLKQNT